MKTVTGGFFGGTAYQSKVDESAYQDANVNASMILNNGFPPGDKA